MVKNLLILSVIISTLGCSNPKNNEHILHKLTTIKNQNHPNYTLTGRQTGFNYEIFSKDTLSTFGLELELSNKSDSLPAIYLMTCSWGPDSGVTNPINFAIGTPCDANFWRTVKIKKDDVLELKTSVILEKDIGLKEYEIQLGIVLVDTTEVSWIELGSKASDELIHNKQKLEKDVVWSNVIILKKLESDIKHGGKWQLVKK